MSSLDTKNAMTSADSAAERLRILYEAGKILSSTLSAEEIYDRLRDLVCRQMPCDGIIVSSWDAASGLIRCEYAWAKGVRLDQAEFPPIPLGPEGTGMQSEVIRTGKPLPFRNVRQRVQDERGVFYDVGPDGELRPADEDSDTPRTQSAIMAPVIRDERAIGVLQVMSDLPDAYSDDDLALLEALITQMTVAIHNAALYADAQRQVEERTKAEERLRDSNEMLRLAMRSGRMGAWFREVSDNTVVWTPELEELFGLPPGGFGGTERAFYEMVHPEDVAETAAEIRAATEEHRDYAIEFRFRHDSGEWRWMEGRGRAIYDAAGARVRLHGVGIDVTERKLQQAQISALNESLKRAMAESHHRIKNNLQVLSALVQVQIDDGQPTVARSAMERLSAHVRGLAALHELLTMKFAGGEGEVVSLLELLDRLTPLIRAAAGSRDLVLQADEVLVPLRQAGSFSMLVNELVSNAVKHGEGRVEVVLRALDGGQAELVVSDEGPGLPDGFDPSGASSTGLDLIMTLATWDLQGTVNWTNTAPRGAHVVVTFPLSPQPE